MAEQVRVLVTHDVPSRRLEIAALLTAAGCETRTAHNGLAALAVLADGWRPACVLMKPGVPGLDGASFRAELNVRGSLASIPLLAIIASQAERSGLGDMAPDEV